MATLNDAIDSTTNPDGVRTVAFYLPQFHPIPENDEWWGPGFTEWTNVARGKKRFPGHYQPRIPGELGFYDLRLPETREAQAALAAEHGINAFCYWHYWLGGGQRLLERPFQEVLDSGRPRFPFCLGWANQTWTGIWYGAPDRVLAEQRYPGETDILDHFEAVLPAFRDERYFRVDGKPLFYVYRPELLPDAQRFLDLWREAADRADLPGIYFVGQASGTIHRTSDADFDAWVTGHIPWRSNWRARWARRIRGLFGLPTVRSYARYSASMPRLVEDVTAFPAVVPGWDNTARSGARGLVLHDATPGAFQEQVARARECVLRYSPDRRIIFIKSWNEWAMGNYIEPDARHGRAFLEAFQKGLSNSR